MGGRKSGSFRDLRRSSASTRRAVRHLNQTILGDAAPKLVVGAALGVIASSGPVGTTFVAAVKVAETVHDMYAATKRAQEKGASLPNALARAVAETAVSNVADHVAAQAVQAAIPGVIKSAGFKVNDVQRKLITSAVTGAID